MSYPKKISAILFSFVTLLPALNAFSSETGSSFQPYIQHDASGNRVVIWMTLSEDVMTIQSNTLSLQGEWSAPITISTQSRNVVGRPSLSMNATGQTVVVWESFDTSTMTNCVEMAMYSVGGTWSAPLVISDSTEDVKIGEHQLSLDDAGNFLIVWSAHMKNSPKQFQIRTATGTFGSFMGTPTTISN